MKAGPRAERGSVSMELVILAPALVLLVLFVLWAGRGGRAGLVADLAAGEAAVVASLCCEDGDDPDAMAQRNQVVANVLAARPGLDFLCVHGIQGAAVGGEYVDEAWVANFEPEVEGAARGVGAIGVRFECETDGAVAPLRGLFPNVSFFGQATEVIAIPPQPVLSITAAYNTEGHTTDPADNKLTFLFELSGPTNQAVDVYYQTQNSGTGPTHAKSTDYTAVPTENMVSIPPLAVSTTVEIDITRDDIYEGDETFELEWRIVPSNPCAANAPVLKDPLAPFADANNDCIPDDLDFWKAQPATGTIHDDDPEPTLTVSPASATEGSAVDFVVGLSDPTGLDVAFDYQTSDGTATQPGDYTRRQRFGHHRRRREHCPFKHGQRVHCPRPRRARATRPLIWR